jgi:hypothetical protein
MNSFRFKLSSFQQDKLFVLYSKDPDSKIEDSDLRDMYGNCLIFLTEFFESIWNEWIHHTRPGNEANVAQHSKTAVFLGGNLEDLERLCKVFFSLHKRLFPDSLIPEEPVRVFLFLYNYRIAIKPFHDIVRQNMTEDAMRILETGTIEKPETENEERG